MSDEQTTDDSLSEEIHRRKFLQSGTVAGLAVVTAGCSDALPFGDDEDSSQNTDEEGGDGSVPEREKIKLGDVVEKRIEDEEQIDPARDGTADPLVFDGEQEQAVEIRMESEELDPYLVLVGPDGDVVAQNDDAAGSLDSQIRTELPSSGTYTIWAGTFSGSETGPYTLALEETEIEDSDNLRSISLGETKDGFIDPDDETDPARGGLAEPVTFQGQQDQAVEITMRSGPIDTYLVLTGPGGDVVAEDDDGAGSLNSRIRTLLPQDGTYTIWAGSFGESETGPYSLSLEERNVESGGDLRSIELGETSDGFIDIGDERDPQRSGLSEPVTFTGEADQGVVIRMESTEIDPYLVLTGPDGEVLAEDDDGASGLNSQLQTPLADAGRYTIWAGSFGEDETGPYTLTLERRDVEGEEDLRSIELGETKRGVIDSADERDPSRDGLSEPVTFEGEADQGVEITMESEQVDPYLVLTGPGGDVIAEDDDGASGFNSRIQTPLPESGTYTIWAGTFSQSDTGPYTLSLESRSVETGGDLDSIEPGETRDGFIDNTDERDPSRDGLSEPVTFEGQADQGVEITMESEQIDPYLVLTGPGGDVIAEDDDGASGLNSRIETTLPESGTYTIWAGTFSESQTGPYTLSVNTN